MGAGEVSHLLHELSGSLSLNSGFFLPVFKAAWIRNAVFSASGIILPGSVSNPGSLGDLLFSGPLWLPARPHVSLTLVSFSPPAGGRIICQRRVFPVYARLISPTNAAFPLTSQAFLRRFGAVFRASMCESGSGEGPSDGALGALIKQACDAKLCKRS